MKPAWTCALHHGADAPRSRKKRDLCEDCVDSLAARSLAWCSKCKHRKKQTDMGSATYCKACDRTRAATYYAAHRETRNAQAQAYYARNRNDIQERKRALYDEQRDAINERRRQRRYANLAAYRERRRKYYQEHRDQERARGNAWRAAHPTYNRVYIRRWRLRQALKGWKQAA